MPLRPRRLHEVGLRPHGGFLGDGTGAVHRQRGHVPVRKRHAVVLRPGNENRRKRSFPPGQRLQAGRRGAVDDPAQRRGMDRGEQFACRFRRRPRHLPRGGTHHQPHLAAVHPFHFGRKGLRHADLGQPHLHRQPQTLRNHGVYRVPGHDGGIRLHGADGAVRQIRLRELLVVPEPHPQNRHRDGPGRRSADRRHPARVAGDGPEQQAVDHHRRRLRGQPLRI